MEHIVSNLRSVKARQVILNGRPWWVAPVTMIVPGVLAGSKGALYYPPEEVAADPQAWDGFPIVVYHPRTQSSARDPEVTNTQWVGNIYRSRVSNGRLTAEAWFDEEATIRVDRRVHAALVNGTRMEISTGLHTVNFPAPPGSTHNGRAYEYVARHYRPDHLAILPDQVGACSIQDGCGLLVANKAACHCGGKCGKCAAAVGNRSGMTARVAKVSGATPFRSKMLDDGLHHHFRSADPEEGAKRVAADFEAEGMRPEVTSERGLWSVMVMMDGEEHMFHFLPEGRLAANSAGRRGLSMTPEKACKILKDGRVHGKRLTKKQRGMFGARCGERNKPSTNAVAAPGYPWQSVANWCNQYGGTTCKDKSRNTRARKRAAKKAPMVKPVPPKPEARRKPQPKPAPQETKKAQAPPAGKPLPTRGTKSNQYSHWQAIGSDVMRATSTLEKLTGEWVNLAKAGKQYPVGEAQDKAVAEALGKTDPRAVARRFGVAQKLTKAKATAKIKQIVRDRPGMVARSMQ